MANEIGFVEPDTIEMCQSILALLNPDMDCGYSRDMTIVDKHADDRVSFDGFRKTTRDEAHWLLVKALGEVAR
jgi:hypothetical protein